VLASRSPSGRLASSHLSIIFGFSRTPVSNQVLPGNLTGALVNMVQKAPSLTLTLEALGGYGALLSSEIKVIIIDQQFCPTQILVC
jgi:hypothetical protein